MPEDLVFSEYQAGQSLELEWMTRREKSLVPAKNQTLNHPDHSTVTVLNELSQQHTNWT
jgi:hypothetical protein